HTYDDTRRKLLSRDNVGFALADVFSKDGSCDLTALFVGSQGTLGTITEAILKVASYNPRTSLLVAGFNGAQALADAVELVAPLGPSCLEMIDRTLISLVKQERNLNVVATLFEPDTEVPDYILFVECDEDNAHKRNKKIKKINKLLSKTATAIRVTDDPELQETLWAARDSSSVVVNYDRGGKVALPVIDDCIVPLGKLKQLISAVSDLAEKHKLELAVWGHAGDANLHVMPLLNLSKLGDRQKIFRLMNDYFTVVIGLGGSIAAENNDGRLRTPFTHLQLGEELVQVNAALKKAADPFMMLNPGVKTGTKLKDVVDLLGDSYSQARHADYLPRQ
ncbi:MAG: FAD-linked oxidase C-terminal domain-containing protein, partial [Dokdonella sp.]